MSQLSQYIERMRGTVAPGSPMVIFVDQTGLSKPPIRCRLSHVVAIETAFDDLACIRKACERMGWELIEGQQTFKWYGRVVGDYHGNDAAQNLDVKAEDFGKCQHAIRVPGASYEIGLVERDGEFVPVWDFWQSGGLKDITTENGMGGFMQAYAVEKAKKVMLKQGLRPREVRQGDKIQLVATA